MDSAIVFKTKGTERGQAILILITFVMTIIFLLFFLFTPTVNMGITLLLEISVSFFVNYHFRSYFDMTIKDGWLILENLWGKKSYPLTEVVSIRRKLFPFFYPFNAFLVLRAKDAEFTIRMDNAPWVHVSKGGVKEYIANLIEIIKRQKKSYPSGF